MGKSTGSAPEADPAIGEAALMNAELGEEWLAFAEEQFAVGNERQEATDALTNEVIDQQMATQERANTWAQEDRARTLETFQPLEDEFISEAKNYGSEANQDKEAAAAAAQVQKDVASQKQASERNMASMGISPTSGRYAGVDRAGELNTALATSGVKNAARDAVKQQGIALKADAINMGKGLASSAASAYGIGLNAGNSAVANQGAANSNFYANQGVMQSGYQGGMQGYSTQGSMLNSLYNSQVNAYSAEQQANATSGAGIGSLLGQGIGAYAAF